jgi:peptide/nickel transport system substrate-binding protein
MRSLRAAALAASALAAAIAATPAGAQTLRMGVGAQVTSIDPHYHNISPNNAFATMVFGTLLDTDGNSKLVPGMAESWKPVAEDVWEFKLRPGVTFHNGAPFTADDFAFTVERIPQVLNSPGSFRTYTQAIKGVEVVDPLTLRITTNGPYPMLPTDVAQVAILSRAIHTGATTDRFNNGELAIGTGPFRLASARPGDRAELVRNDTYWGTKPAWERVDYRMVTSPAARLTSLLAGDVDFIDQVPTTDIERMRADKTIKLSESGSLRFIYLAFDQSRDDKPPFATALDGKPLDKNPMKDVRVRRALSLALDRQAIVDRVMEGVALPINQFMPPGTFAHAPELETNQRADIPQARKLLAEAGFPNGFALTLHGPNDRYPNDGRIAQAVGQMWSRVGVRTQVEVSPYAAFVVRASRQEFSAFLVSWGSSTGEPSAGLRSVLGTYDRARGLGSVNRFRYSNPKFDDGLIAAMRELDEAKREAMLQSVTRLAIGEDVAIAPTHVQKNVWAMRQGFRHEARIDERTRAQDVHPAK